MLYITGESGKNVNEEGVVLHQFEASDMAHEHVFLRKPVGSSESVPSRGVEGEPRHVDAVVHDLKILPRIHELSRGPRTGQPFGRILAEPLLKSLLHEVARGALEIGDVRVRE